MDNKWNMLITDTSNNRIRKITPNGVVSTLVGNTAGDVDGSIAAAKFKTPSAMVIDAVGNVIFIDADNNKIKKISPSGVVSIVAGSGKEGKADGLPKDATFAFSLGIAIDSKGNLIVVDTDNHRIRKIEME